MSNAPAWRDRIVGLERLRAGDLVPHPLNARRHSDAQRSALLGALHQVGIVDAVVVRRLPDGRFQTLDGHLRGSLDAEARLPALVVDLNDEEARLFIATSDAIGALAETDVARVRALTDGLRVDDAALRSVVEALRDEQAPAVPPDEFPAVDPSKLATTHRCPSCGYAWSGQSA